MTWSRSASRVAADAFKAGSPFAAILTPDQIVAAFRQQAACAGMIVPAGLPPATIMRTLTPILVMLGARRRRTGQQQRWTGISLKHPPKAEPARLPVHAPAPWIVAAARGAFIFTGGNRDRLTVPPLVWAFRASVPEDRAAHLPQTDAGLLRLLAPALVSLGCRRGHTQRGTVWTRLRLRSWRGEADIT